MITTEYAKQVDNSNAKLNGNQFVKTEHVFVPGEGCFFPSAEKAMSELSYNAIGKHVCAILELGGKTWFQAGATNIWD
jgi:hypothetical protein